MFIRCSTAGHAVKNHGWRKGDRRETPVGVRDRFQRRFADVKWQTPYPAVRYQRSLPAAYQRAHHGLGGSNEDTVALLQVSGPGPHQILHFLGEPSLSMKSHTTTNTTCLPLRTLRTALLGSNCIAVKGFVYQNLRPSEQSTRKLATAHCQHCPNWRAWTQHVCQVGI